MSCDYVEKRRENFVLTYSACVVIIVKIFLLFQRLFGLKEMFGKSGIKVYCGVL